MLKLFLMLAWLIMFGFFIFLILDMSGSLQARPKASKIYPFVKKYSSWILGLCAIILYLLTKQGILIANLLLIPYLFFLVMIFLTASIQTNINLVDHVIIISSIFAPFVFVLFPYLLLKIFILIGFIIISAHNIYEDITLCKKTNCIRLILSSMPILVFLAITLFI